MQFAIRSKTSVVLEEEEDFEDSNMETEQFEEKRVYTGAQIAISIFGGFAFSTVLLGLLFKIQSYPGADLMLTSGLFLIFGMNTGFLTVLAISVTVMTFVVLKFTNLNGII